MKRIIQELPKPKYIFDLNTCELLYFSISLACNSYNLQTLTD